MASVTTVDGIQVTFAPKGVLAPADHDANTGMAITCVYGVTKEALRISESATAFYGDTVNGRIGAVVFAAPDIDMDVFSSAITRIGPLAGKITVIASTNDRALALSGDSRRDDAGRRCREGRHRAARGARDRCFRYRLGHHQPRFVPIE